LSDEDSDIFSQLVVSEDDDDDDDDDDDELPLSWSS